MKYISLESFGSALFDGEIFFEANIFIKHLIVDLYTTMGGNYADVLQYEVTINVNGPGVVLVSPKVNNVTVNASGFHFTTNSSEIQIDKRFVLPVMNSQFVSITLLPIGGPVFDDSRCYVKVGYEEQQINIPYGGKI